MGSELNGAHNSLISQMTMQMNRIEGKVDTMQAAFIQMAKTEERVVRLLEADQKKTEWLMTIQDRVVELEKKEVGQRAVTSRVERIMWIMVTAGLTGFVGWLIAVGSV